MDTKQLAELHRLALERGAELDTGDGKFNTTRERLPRAKAKLNLQVEPPQQKINPMPPEDKTP